MHIREKKKGTTTHCPLFETSIKFKRQTIILPWWPLRHHLTTLMQGNAETGTS